MNGGRPEAARAGTSGTSEADERHAGAQARASGLHGHERACGSHLVREVAVDRRVLTLEVRLVEIVRVLYVRMALGRDGQRRVGSDQHRDRTAAARRPRGALIVDGNLRAVENTRVSNRSHGEVLGRVSCGAYVAGIRVVAAHTSPQTTRA